MVSGVCHCQLMVRFKIDLFLHTAHLICLASIQTNNLITSARKVRVEEVQTERLSAQEMGTNKTGKNKFVLLLCRRCMCLYVSLVYGFISGAVNR